MKLPVIISVIILGIAALLYAAFFNGANTDGTETAQNVDFPVERLETMRKMKIHNAPEAAIDAEFFDPAGNGYFLADSNGKIRVVNFWATWCAPCREEMPELDSLQVQLGGADFEVIVIATGRNTLDGIERFNTQANIQNLPVRLDPQGALGNKFGALGLPLTVVLDREGREIARLTGGADWASDNAIEILQAMIDRPIDG